MKKLVLALTAVAAFTGSAVAADLPARTYSKAPAPVAMAPSWTGCYVGGGVGYGMYNTENTQVDPVTGAFIAAEGTGGGRGYFGNAQVGCDYQFAGPLGSWVVGAFGDYSFMDVHGQHLGGPFTTTVGNLKEDSAWAAGARIGYLVNPTFLSYVNAGWTQTHFASTNFNGYTTGLPTGTALPGTTYNGWFLGSGFEYSLSFLPGLYLKSEYRFSQFDRKQINYVFTASGLPTGTAETMKPYTQSVITSLVYRFNWGGPVVAKY